MPSYPAAGTVTYVPNNTPLVVIQPQSVKQRPSVVFITFTEKPLFKGSETFVCHRTPIGWRANIHSGRAVCRSVRLWSAGLADTFLQRIIIIIIIMQRLTRHVSVIRLTNDSDLKYDLV